MASAKPDFRHLRATAECQSSLLSDPDSSLNGESHRAIGGSGFQSGVQHDEQRSSLEGAATSRDDAGGGEAVGGVVLEVGVDEGRVSPADDSGGPASTGAGVGTQEAPRRLTGLDARIERAEKRLDSLLEQRARLIASAAEKLRATLAMRAGRRRNRPRFPVADWSSEAPLVLLAMALLVPWLHVLSRGTRDATTGCFVVGSNGYARGGRGIGQLHRFVLMLASGSALEGRLACHRCDNKPCIEPSHLYAGTAADNQRDRQERIIPKPARCNLPRFSTWPEWVDGDWRAGDVPLIRDLEGIEGEVDLVDLPLSALQRIDSARPNFLRGMDEESENARGYGNPDSWSEEDERSLMVLGYLDKQEPKEWARFRPAWRIFGSATGRFLVRRPA